MIKIEETGFCDGCGAEILLMPVIEHYQEYCCEDGARGYECHCGEQIELDEARRTDHSREISTRGAV